MAKYSGFGTRKTPQSQPIPGSSQVKNSAGGYSWQVDNWELMKRFLILGTESPTYYADQRTHTIASVRSVEACLKQDPAIALRMITDISVSGRAPKNDPALLALAMACSSDNPITRGLAFDALPHVARTSTHLFDFLTYVQEFRGWGRALRKAVNNWYIRKGVDGVAYQLIKYRQRNGWTHRDVLRKAHPSVDGPMSDLFGWVTQGKEPKHEQVDAYLRLQDMKRESDVIKTVVDYNLPWEAVPTEWHSSKGLWQALIPNMGITALVRNLARMTSNGAVEPMSNQVNDITERLTDEKIIASSRVHPIQFLSALLTYRNGAGYRGSMRWNPIHSITDALDKAFYLSFGNVEPSHKRTLLALDVSGSMASGYIAGVPFLSPRVGSAAMALVTMATEKRVMIHGFSTTFVKLDISPRQRLDDAVRRVSGLPFSGTDCALPMTWALQNRIPIDTFVVYTDSETWFGGIHPSQALVEYRQKMGIPAKLVVVGMVANKFSIADPNDAGMLDVVGFDTATPNLISDFSRSEQ